MPDLKALIAVGSVLLGTLTSVLNSRLTDIGLSDIRGALGLGFDEASWITTAYVVAEVAAVPVAVWLRGVVSQAPTLIFGSLFFSLLSLAAPFSPNLQVMLAIQGLRGLSAGLIIPTTYSVVMRYTPKPMRLYALSLYAITSGFTPSFSSYLEATIVADLSWRFLFWCSALPGALTILAAAYGLKFDPIKLTKLRRPDLFGLLLLSMGFGSLVAAMDQGNRLDWLSSGLIVALLSTSVFMLAAYAVHSFRNPRAVVAPHILARANISLGLAIMLVSRVAATSGSFVIPQFLARMQGYRALESGGFFLIAGLPTVALTPLIAWLCFKIDVRNLIAFGAIVFGAGVLVGTKMTSVWTGHEFMPALLLQTVGACFLSVPVMALVTEDIFVPEIPWLASMVQLTRTVGSSVGLALVGTVVRVREQVHSNITGLHVQGGGIATQDRLDILAASLAAKAGAADASSQAVALIARTIQRESYVLAYQDALYTLAVIILLSALMAIFLKPTKLPGRFL
jgi:DHA2 family multidrug resistance protein